MGITKNKQSLETIAEMVRRAFPDKKILKVKELTEGMCNVTYDISFTDESECILKIASKGNRGRLSNEANLMEAEVAAMNLAGQGCSFKVPEVFYYDTTKELCDGDYFFMEKLQGENLFLVREELPEETGRQISRETGGIARELSRIQNKQFGLLGEERRYDTLFQFVKALLTNLLSDAEGRDIDVIHNRETFLLMLEADKDAFEEVKSASLVHWDMWEGNIFIKDGHVSGIIDWERAMWGEPFMDDRFRRHTRSREFLEGFGQTDFSEKELVRLRWYDRILYLTMMIEVFYREYEDQGQYVWARGMLEEALSE